MSCRDAFYVGKMAKAADRFQRIVTRNNFLFRCTLPDFASFEVCSERLIKGVQKTMQANLDMAATYHQMLFLGANKLETFQDPRLQVRNGDAAGGSWKA